MNEDSALKFNVQRQHQLGHHLHHSNISHNQHNQNHHQHTHHNQHYQRSQDTAWQPRLTNIQDCHLNTLQQSNVRHAKKKLFCSELLATLVFTYLGQCALTSFELIGSQNDSLVRYLGVCLCYGCAFFLACAMRPNQMRPITCFNPALTFANAAFKLIPWSHVVPLIGAQYSGAFLMAPLLHTTYIDKLSARHDYGLLVGMNETLRAHGNALSTGKLFTSFPPVEVSLTQLFISYALATCFFAFIVNSIWPTRPVYLATALVMTLTAFGANGGPVINPALDLSPRLYISMFGWGSAAFNLFHYNYWWFCAILAPHLGACLGLALHKVYLLTHH